MPFALAKCMQTAESKVHSKFDNDFGAKHYGLLCRTGFPSCAGDYCGPDSITCRGDSMLQQGMPPSIPWRYAQLYAQYTCTRTADPISELA